MHQFGHVYALQQELLAQDKSNWFRAVELWHTARQEGLALNCAHYTNILRQCVKPAAWEQSLKVLKQMRRDAIRPDVVGVACAMAATAEAGRAAETASVFRYFHDEKKMKLDSQCFLALVKAHQSSRNHNEALATGRQQEAEEIPLPPATYVALLESAVAVDNADALLHYVSRMKEDRYVLPAAIEMNLRSLADKRGDRRLAAVLDGGESDGPLQLGFR